MQINAEQKMVLASSPHAGDEKFPALLGRLHGRMPELDGLRGIAVIIVVWHNVTAGGYTGGTVEKMVNLVSNAGWMGVQLFFVLSGFLITGILLDQKGTPQQWRNFTIRRALRIFPLYYATLATGFLLLPALGLLPPFSEAVRENHLWYWLFLMNWWVPAEIRANFFGHFWSLAVEEQFYLFWPMVAIFCRTRTLVRICVFMLVSAPLIRYGLIIFDHQLAAKTAYNFTIARWDALAGGALLAIALRERISSERVFKLAKPAFYFAAFFMIAYIAFNRNFAAVEGVTSILNQTVAILFFCSILIAAIDPDNRHSQRWQAFLRGQPLMNVGKYSYAIYVFHLPLKFLWGPQWKTMAELPILSSSPLISQTLLAVVVFFSALLLAYCSWHALELPFLRLKSRFSPAASVAA